MVFGGHASVLFIFAFLSLSLLSEYAYSAWACSWGRCWSAAGIVNSNYLAAVVSSSDLLVGVLLGRVRPLVSTVILN